MLSENVISEKAISDHIRRGVLVPDQKSRFLRSPTLMGTNNLNENGPNPCFFFTKNMVRVNLTPHRCLMAAKIPRRL